jgi:hypothetical protein
MDVTNEMIDAAQSELSNLIGDSELERSYIKAAIEAVIQVMLTNKDKEDFKI